MTQPNNPDGNGVPEGVNPQSPVDPTASAPWDQASGWGAPQQPSAPEAGGWGAPQQGQASGWGAPQQGQQGQGPAWGAPQQGQQGQGPAWGAPQQPSAPEASGWGAPQQPSAPEASGWGAPQQPSAPEASGWGAPQADQTTAWGTPAAAGASTDGTWGAGAPEPGGDAWGQSSTQSYGTGQTTYGAAPGYGGGGPGGPGGYTSYEDAPKKKMTWLWALIGALVLIGAVVAALFATGVLGGGEKEATAEDIAAWHTACEGGDAEACEDLFQNAPVDSDEYLYGETCGGRTDGTVACTPEVMANPAGSWSGTATDPTTAPADPTTEPVAPTTEPVAPTTPPGTELILLDDWLSECQGGNMTSCDLLYYYSDVDSEEEAIAVSCGGNADASATGGTCSGFNPEATTYGSDTILDGLYDQCSAGEMRACDDLYFLAPSDSDYQGFGETCGGRQAEGYSYFCSN